MPTYCYKCDCGKTFEIILPMSNSSEPQKCECGKIAKRDLAAEHSQGNIDGLMKENVRYSVSGAVLEEDLPKARKLHPGREWKRFGNSWRPEIRNRVDKLKFMKEAGAFEY